MVVSTAVVSGSIPLPDDTVNTDLRVRFSLTSFDTDASASAVIMPDAVEVLVGSDGSFSATLWPNGRGVRYTQYRVEIVRDPRYNRFKAVDLGNIEISEVGSYDLYDLLGITAQQLPSINRAASEAARLAEAWATAETEVQPGLKSSRKYAEENAATLSATTTARDAAQTAATSAASEASVAVAAADASGDIAFFDTKAGLIAELAGLPDGQAIQVDADESRDGIVSRYRKESGSAVFKYHPLAADAQRAVKKIRLSARDNDVRDFDGTPDLRVKTTAALAEVTYAKAAVGDLVAVEETGALVEVQPQIVTNPHFDFTATGGVPFNVRKRNGAVFLSHFAPDAANAKVALKKAAETLVLRDELVIDQPITVNYSAWTDSVKIPLGVTIDWRAPITTKSFGIPVMWSETDGTNTGIILKNPKILYDAEHPLINEWPQYSEDFYAATFGQGEGGNYARGAHHAGLFFRGNTVHILGLCDMRSVDCSAPEKLLPKGFVMLKGRNGESGNLYAQGFWFDGTLMGIVGTGVDDFRTGSIFTDRWSQLNPAVYGTQAPGHGAYCTPDDSGTYNIQIGIVVDTGREVGTPYVSGAATVKCSRRASSFICGFIWSRRSQGILDLEAENIKLAGGYWDGTLSGQDKTGPQIMRISNFNNGGNRRGDLGRWYLRMPADYNDYIEIYAELCVGSFTFEIPGTDQAVPLIAGKLERCVFDMSALMPQSQEAGPPTLVRIDGGGSHNLIRVTTDSPQWAGMRAIAQDKAASTGNSVTIRTHDGSERTLGGYADSQRVRKSVDVVLTGASVPVSGFIPKGGDVRGMSSQVIENIASTGGAEGYLVGTASDPDLYGNRQGLTGGLGTADWTDDGSGWQGQPLDLVVTPRGAGAVFQGGKLKLTAVYETMARNGDLI